MGLRWAGAAMVGRQAISSEMRSSAPDAFWISPHTSPSSRAEEAARADSIRSCSSTPGVMVWSTNTAMAQR